VHSFVEVPSALTKNISFVKQTIHQLSQLQYVTFLTLYCHPVPAPTFTQALASA
jgi:hypothetical protein